MDYNPYDFYKCVYCDVFTLNEDNICDKCFNRYNCCPIYFILSNLISSLFL